MQTQRHNNDNHYYVYLEIIMIIFMIIKKLSVTIETNIETNIFSSASNRKITMFVLSFLLQDDRNHLEYSD